MSALVAAKALFIFAAVVLGLAPLVAWAERKQSALIQDRIGANRASIGGVRLLGLLQPAADLFKLLMKEDIVPAGANRVLYALAPALVAVPALVAFAVIPYGGSYTLGETTFTLVAADIDWGVLYILAIGAMTTYGSVLAGWASNNHWSLLGGLRSAAQMISYEVALGLTLVPLFLVFGTLALTEMGQRQDGTFALLGWLSAFGLPLPEVLLTAPRLPSWGIFLQPVAFVLFLTCAMAASRRPPFDLPESPSELVAGYHTEYSGARFGLFQLSEFVRVVVVAGLVTAIFLGGWSIPYLEQEVLIGFVSGFFGQELATITCMVVHAASFFAKVCAVIWLQMMIRWSQPRFRHDQLMSLCWKAILPLALLNVFATALFVLALEAPA